MFGKAVLGDFDFQKALSLFGNYKNKAFDYEIVASVTNFCKALPKDFWLPRMGFQYFTSKIVLIYF
jgi:hypothetical protein